MSSRSSVSSEIVKVRDRLRRIGSEAGAEVKELDGYPGWKPEINSALLGVVKRICEEMFGKTPEISAVHAGQRLAMGIIFHDAES